MTIPFRHARHIIWRACKVIEALDLGCASLLSPAPAEDARTGRRGGTLGFSWYGAGDLEADRR